MKEGKRRGEILIALFIILSIFCIFLIYFMNFLAPISSESGINEWKMAGRYLNHTAYDGVDFTLIPGLNKTNFSDPEFGTSTTVPAIANGYAYVTCLGSYVYQLNASNVSQMIAKYQTSASTYQSSPAVTDKYVYVGVLGKNFYQLNASDISQKIANFSGLGSSQGSPAVANGYVYVHTLTPNALYQLNASNVSQQIANHTTIGFSDGTPAVAGNYVYTTDSVGIVYQLNASNVSQQIANFTNTSACTSFPADNSPIVYRDSLYTCTDQGLYQLNASNVSQTVNFLYIMDYMNFECLTPAIANGYLYTSVDRYVYQLNILNISQKIARYNTGSPIAAMATVTPTSVYISAANNYIYQLNASNVSKYIASFYVGTYSSIGFAHAKNYLYFGSAQSSPYNLIYQINATNISIVSEGCTENWTCDDWGECLESGYQYRDCNDLNGCGTIIHRPDRWRSCGTEEEIEPGTSPGQPSVTTGASSLIPNEPTEIQIDNSQIDITSLSVNVKETVHKTSFTIQKLSESKAVLKARLPTGEVYQAVEIIPMGVTDENIVNTTIKYRVNKTWLTQNNLALDVANNKIKTDSPFSIGDMTLYRRQNNSIDYFPFKAKFVGQDSKYYYFSSTSPGFSTFIVFFSKYECLPGTKRCFDNNIQLCMGNSTWLIEKRCLYGCTDGECTFSEAFSSMVRLFPYSLIITIISVSIVLVLYLIWKRIKRKK